MTKINDTDAVILANASGRSDLKALPLPEGLRVSGAAANKVLDKLVKAGLLASVDATREDVAWKDDGEGQRKTLVVTPDGLRAIGIETEAQTITKKPTSRTKVARKAPTRPHTRSTSAKSRTGAAKTPRKTPPARTGAKAATKQEIVVSLLRRASGASIAELAKAAGWQPHSVRGVLTATVKGRLGLPVISEKGEDGVRRYFVAPIQTSKGKTS